jgi:hypothetical protein
MNRALTLILGMLLTAQPACGMVSLRQRFSALVPIASALYKYGQGFYIFKYKSIEVFYEV